MLYNAEKSYTELVEVCANFQLLTITPELKLNEAERKALLSWILKFLYRGTKFAARSTQIIDDPKTQAVT